MNNLDNLRSDFDKEWQRYGVYHGKNLIKNIPSWEEILKTLNSEIRRPNPTLFTEPSNNDFEIVYKDMIAMKKLHFSDEQILKNAAEANTHGYGIESEATFFFSLFFEKDRLSEILPESTVADIESINKIIDVDTSFTSLKVSLADKLTPFEAHVGHTCIIQLSGLSFWKLRDKEVGLDDLYVIGPGDYLFFKENVEHELSNEEPRSSLVGRFTFGESHG
jgi:hypothetical protein